MKKRVRVWHIAITCDCCRASLNGRNHQSSTYPVNGEKDFCDDRCQTEWEHRRRCANCGRTDGAHKSKDNRCPKVIDGKIIKDRYTRTKFKAHV